LSVSAENIARAETLLWPDCKETSVAAQPSDFELHEPLIQQRNSLDCTRCESNLDDVGTGASQIGMSPKKPPTIADNASTVTDCVEDASPQHDFNPRLSVAFRTAGQQALLSVAADDVKRAETLLLNDGRDTSELLQPSEIKTQCLRRESSWGNVGTETRQTAASDNGAAALTNCKGEDLTQHDSDPSLSVSFRTAGRQSMLLVSADAVHKADSLLLPNGSDTYVLVRPIDCKAHIQQRGSLECLRPRSNVDNASTGASRNAIASSKEPSAIDFGVATADGTHDDLLPYNDSSLSLGFRTAGQKSVLSVSADAMDRAQALLLPFEQPSDCKPLIPLASPQESLRSPSDTVATGGSKIAVLSIRAPSIVGGETMASSMKDVLAQQSLDPSPSLGFRTAGQRSNLSVSADDIARATALLLPVGKDAPILVRPNDDKPRGSLECLRRESHLEMDSIRQDKIATKSKMSHRNIDGSATIATNNLGDDLQYDIATRTLRTPSEQYIPVFRGPFITPGSSGYDDLRRQLIECSGRDCKFLVFDHSPADISRLTP
jgi:hypothetical protein